MLLEQVGRKFLVSSGMLIHLLLLKMYTYLHLLLAIAVVVHTEVTSIYVKQLFTIHIT